VPVGLFNVQPPLHAPPTCRIGATNPGLRRDQGGERRRFLAYLNGTANIMLSTALFPRVHVLYSKGYQFRNVSLKPNVSIYLYGQSCEIVKLSLNSNCSEKHVVMKPTTVDSQKRVISCQGYSNHPLIHKTR
jgi:hypothetical protein